LIERTSINRTVTLTAGSANDSERPNVSRWQLKLPQAATTDHAHYVRFGFLVI